MIRFIHTADVHFGVENYGKIDPETGIHSRLLDFHRALNICIDAALEHQVDFFLFSGDAYKTATPSPTQQRLLMKSFFRLYQAKIPVIIIVGNHDHPLTFGKAHALDVFKELPIDGFHVVAKPQIISLTTASGPVNIVGIPWPSRATLALSAQHLQTSGVDISLYLGQSVAKIIAHLAQQLDIEIPAVLAGHLTVSSGLFSGSEKRAIYGNDPLLLPSQLAIKPFDYVGLGHLHRHQNLNPNGYPAIVYSGSIERIDFGERKEEKGFCLVTIEGKGTTSYQFIPLPTRPFVQLDIKLETGTSQTDQIIQALKQHELKQAVLKILYHLPPGAKDEVDIKEIQRACASAAYIAGIMPIHTEPHRERRMKLSIAMDLPTLLNQYFDSKEDLKKQKQELIQKIMELEQEVQNSNLDRTGLG